MKFKTLNTESCVIRNETVDRPDRTNFDLVEIQETQMKENIHKQTDNYTLFCTNDNANYHLPTNIFYMGSDA